LKRVVLDERVALAGQALAEEETVPQVDGAHTHLSVEFSLQDATGRPYAVSCISTDITDRGREQRAQAQLAAIVESSEDTIIIGKTPDGIIRTWNPGAEVVRLFGGRGNRETQEDAAKRWSKTGTSWWSLMGSSAGSKPSVQRSSVRSASQRSSQISACPLSMVAQ
jgi:hypothetical protein